MPIALSFHFTSFFHLHLPKRPPFPFPPFPMFPRLFKIPPFPPFPALPRLFKIPPFPPFPVAPLLPSRPNNVLRVLAPAPPEATPPLNSSNNPVRASRFGSCLSSSCIFFFFLPLSRELLPNMPDRISPFPPFPFPPFPSFPF